LCTVIQFPAASNLRDSTQSLLCVEIAAVELIAQRTQLISRSFTLYSGSFTDT